MARQLLNLNTEVIREQLEKAGLTMTDFSKLMCKGEGYVAKAVRLGKMYDTQMRQAEELLGLEEGSLELKEEKKEPVQLQLVPVEEDTTIQLIKAIERQNNLIAALYKVVKAIQEGNNGNAQTA